VKVGSASLSMGGATVLRDPAVIGPLLSVLEEHGGLRALGSGEDDGQPLTPYDRAAIDATIAAEEHKESHVSGFQFFSMPKGANPDLMIGLSRGWKPGLSKVISPPFGKELADGMHMVELCALMVELEKVYPVEYAIASASPEKSVFQSLTKEDRWGWTNTTYWIKDRPGLTLGWHTWFGPHLVDLFGRDLLLSTPVPEGAVTELDSGVVRLDLTAPGADVSFSELLELRQDAAAHLAPAEVLATFVHSRRVKFFQPGARCVINAPDEPEWLTSKRAESNARIIKKIAEHRAQNAE